MGIRRTTGRVRRQFYWPGYKNDIVVWCSRCAVCQKRKSPSKKHRASIKQYSVGAPFKHIALDIMGPLPESQQGNIDISQSSVTILPDGLRLLPWLIKEPVQWLMYLSKVSSQGLVCLGTVIRVCSLNPNSFRLFANNWA